MSEKKNKNDTLNPVFELGEIIATKGVADVMNADKDFKKFCLEKLVNHSFGEWGDLCKRDKKLNDEALTNGTRILSAYEYESDLSKKIWIITEADRSHTTILFPDEY